MTRGFPVQSGRQFGPPTLRHADYCLHPVGRGFELPGINRVRLRDRHRAQHAGQLAAGRPIAAQRADTLHQRHHRITASPYAGGGHGRRHTGLHTLLKILGCKNPRIPEHQRLGDGRVGFAENQRLAATGTRRAQRHRTHPRGQRIQPSIHAQRIQAGPSVEHGHGTILMASRSLFGTDRTHARFETGSGDDNHRLASYIAHQTLRLAGQNYWHATEQSGQLRRSAGSPHTHHAHTFMPTARALPVDGGSPTPAASRCRIPAVGRQLQRSGTLGTTHLTMAFRTAQGLTDIVLRNG